jgi:hypothetical protein
MVHRFHLRTLLIAVAIVAVVLGVLAMRWRAEHYRALAERHAFLASVYQAGESTVGGIGPDGRTFSETRSLRDPRKVRYHAALKERYERAACYPWLSVETDPPPPE